MTLKNTVTLKSRLGVTHSANLRRWHLRTWGYCRR